MTAERLPGRRSPVLTLAMLAFLVYFLLPLFWLVVASTKTTGDLFSSFGLWFADDFSLPHNVREVFVAENGVYARWLLNTALYAVVSAGGAALLAALGGYGFAKFRFPGNNALFGVVLGSIMVPSTALARRTWCSARSASSTRRGPSSCPRW
jgi:multiple sugar transport system permease protein